MSFGTALEQKSEVCKSDSALLIAFEGLWLSFRGLTTGIGIENDAVRASDEL